MRSWSLAQSCTLARIVMHALSDTTQDGEAPRNPQGVPGCHRPERPGRRRLLCHVVRSLRAHRSNRRGDSLPNSGCCCLTSLQKWSTEYSDVHFVKVDVDQNEACRLYLSLCPCVNCFAGGRQRRRHLRHADIPLLQGRRQGRGGRGGRRQKDPGSDSEVQVDGCLTCMCRRHSIDQPKSALFRFWLVCCCCVACA